ncbi:MAG: hypothetical protein KBT72_03780 [Zhongshania sp.]|nr:hypothetical protein [Zhongshania sp.]
MCYFIFNYYYFKRLFMDISMLQKQLQEEHKALDQKFKFISDLQALMTKHGQSTEDLLAILTSVPSVPVAPAKKRGRKPGTKNVVAKASVTPVAKKARKKAAPRPLRTFKNSKTGEVAETRAPQVDKVIKTWAKELKVDWRTLEV